MSICADRPWTGMELIKDPQHIETFDFTEVRIVDGIIRGNVKKNNQYVSDLSGTCSPFNSQEDLVRLNFFFTAPRASGYVDIVLSGLGIKLANGQVVFRGGFVALATTARQDTQANPEIMVTFDPGDTGTGTGMQT